MTPKKLFLFPGIIKQIKPIQFHKDYELYISQFDIQSKDATKGLKLPPIYQVLEERQHPNYAFENSAFHPEFCWLTADEAPSESQVDVITKQLVTWHKQQRIKIFQDLARTKAARRSKEFLRHYISPSGAIGGRRKRLGACRKPKRPKKYHLDEWAFRTPEENLRERERVREYLQKVIEADIRRIEREKEEEERKEAEKRKKAERARRAAANREKVKRLPNQEYMERLKKKEMQ